MLITQPALGKFASYNTLFEQNNSVSVTATARTMLDSPPINNL
jgi:hypothetical protein